MTSAQDPSAVDRTVLPTPDRAFWSTKGGPNGGTRRRTGLNGHGSFTLSDLLHRGSRATANSDALIAPSVTARLLAAFCDTGTRTPPAQPVEPLTHREEELRLAPRRRGLQGLIRGANPGEPYPGDEGTETLVDSLCLGGLTDYVGIDYLGSKWDYGFYLPSEESWTKFDDRGVVCYLTDPPAGEVEGTKLNSMT